MERRRLASAAALAALAAAVLSAFLPLFRDGVSALTGDNLTHSWPLNYEVARSLHGGAWKFWEPRASFGFPVYAEAQLAWFHPWKLLVFTLFPNLTGHDLLYVSSFFLTGTGGFLVARRLGCGAGTALTGALAITFSPVVLDNLYNVCYAHSTAWAALSLVAFERWWAAPSRRRMVLFAASTALVTTSGYVPTAYALFLFLGVVLVVRLALERTAIVARTFGFAAALALGVGLAALQVFPLAELARHSVRQESVVALNAFPWPNFVGGLVFDSDPALYRTGRYGFFAAPLASVLALVALPFLPLLRDRRALSYVAGIVVCVGAASGPGNALFELLRRVLPGFDRLRILSPFLFVAVVPAGVLLAVLLDAAARGTRTSAERAVVAATALALTLFLLSSLPAQAALPWYRDLGLGLLAVAVLGLAGLRRVVRPQAVSLLWIAVIAVELVAFRSGHRAWLPDSLMDEGRDFARVLGERAQADPGARAIHYPSQSYRAAFEGMVLQHWKSPGYAGFVRTSMRARTPFANLLDDLPFVEANGALPLAGYPELLATMQDELRGRASAAPGGRALDRWQVRWVVLQGDLAMLPRAPGLERIWSDPQGDLELLENTAALPRYQWHATADGGAALEAPATANARPALPAPATPNARPALPAPAAWRRAIEALPWVSPQIEVPYEWEAASAGRLFAAVPFYPGWTASLDGRDVLPERAADGFGSEFPVGPGRHRLEMRFVPHVFHLGVLVSVASAFAALLLARGRAAR